MAALVVRVRAWRCRPGMEGPRNWCGCGVGLVADTAGVPLLALAANWSLADCQVVCWQVWFSALLAWLVGMLRAACASGGAWGAVRWHAVA